jgi:hypothetical protein
MCTDCLHSFTKLLLHIYSTYMHENINLPIVNLGARMSMSLSGNAPAVADSGVVLRAGREHIITLLAHRAVLRNCLNDSSLFPEVTFFGWLIIMSPSTPASYDKTYFLLLPMKELLRMKLCS